MFSIIAFLYYVARSIRFAIVSIRFSFLDGQFPTDLSEIDIEQDHKFLNDYEIDALMR